MKSLLFSILITFTFSQNWDYIIKPMPIQKYVYFSENFKAGGGPFVFNTPQIRRDFTFDSDDILNNGFIQSNDFLTISYYGCPDFRGSTILWNSQINFS